MAYEDKPPVVSLHANKERATAAVRSAISNLQNGQMLDSKGFVCFPSFSIHRLPTKVGINQQNYPEFTSSVSAEVRLN